jgi:YD repeat-containing protein
LAGTPEQAAYAIAVDPAGEVVIGGQTNAYNFPTTSGAYDPTYGATITQTYVGFITKLNATGDLLDWSSYLGSGGVIGNQPSLGVTGVAFDQNGAVYASGVVTSQMGSSSFLPVTTGAFQTAYGGGTSDDFVAKFSGNGASLDYASYLGGSNNEGAMPAINTTPAGKIGGPAIAVDSAGNAFVTDTTSSSNFPTTTGAYQSTLQGTADVYVAKVNPTGTSLVYSTYIGKSAAQQGTAIALDRSDNAYVTGYTTSPLFPTTSGAFQKTLNGSQNAFELGLNTAGTTLTEATYIGGNGSDTGYGIAVDNQGRITVAGQTGSTNFPTYNAFQSSNAGGNDAFLTRLTPTGTLSLSTYLGGSGTDAAQGVGLDPEGAAYLAGFTNSTNFPTTTQVYQGNNAGGYDAWVAKILMDAPAAPVISSINSGVALSTNDWLTSSQNIHISGTAPVGTTVTLERAGVGVLGTASVSAGGTWTYDYSAVTLPAGTYDFRARDSNSSNQTSAYSAPEFLVTVERSGPVVQLTAPSTTNSLGPTVEVTAQDPNGLPNGTTVTLDVNGAAYTTGNLTDGMALIKLPSLAAVGTYSLYASVTDQANNTGTSTTQTMVVQTLSSPGSPTAQVTTSDPVTGLALQQLGDVSVSHALILDQSGDPSQAGNPALVYNSNQVSQKPIVQLAIPTANTTSLPASYSAQLTFNGVVGTTMTFSTTGDSPGDVLTLALQSATTITTTGRYGYSVTVQPSGGTAQTITGSVYVVAADNSVFGAGWTFAGLNQLVSIAADGNGPAGELMVYGSGGARFFAGTTSFTSPTGDNGTLSLSGGTYTYQTPDGQQWIFNSSGLETEWHCPTCDETLQYRYDGSSRLAGITAIDGALSTITYNTGQVIFQSVNGRTTTLTLSSGNLTNITNPDGGVETYTYDTSHRLTEDQIANVQNNYA